MNQSKKQNKPQPGLVTPVHAVSVEAIEPLSLLSPEATQPGRRSVTAQKLKEPIISYPSKTMYQINHPHVFVETISGPATPTKVFGQQQHIVKEVDVEPHRRGRRQVGNKEALGRIQGGNNVEDWLSKLIEHLWPKIRQVIEDTAWETVPPTLDETKPSWVHGLCLKKFNMGHKEPDLYDVRCFVDEEDVIDDVFVEMDMEWNSKIDVEIALEILGQDVSSLIPNFVEEQLAKLFTMLIGVEDLVIKGTLQIAMRPLLYRVPIVQAIQVGFTEMPEFDFSPSVHGGPLGNALGALLPSVKSWLKSTVNEAIWMPYVLPEHYFYPLEENAPDLQRPLGVLHCRVIEAKNIPRMDTFGHADTFVEVYLRHAQRDTTKIVSGKHPTWKNEVFVMPVHSKQHQSLKFALWDYDAFSPNDEIGRCEIAIKDIPEGQAQDLWLDVYNESEEEQKAAKTGEKGLKLSKGQRALRAMATPFTSHPIKGTQLHVKLLWRTWTDEETEFIKHAIRNGVRKTVMSREAQPFDSGFKEMLLSGVVHVTVQQCKGLDVHGLLFRPSVKTVVRVADLEPQETLPFKVSRRGRADLSNALVQVHVPGDVAGHDDVMVRIDLQEVGFLSGNDIAGSFMVSLRELMERKCLSGERQLREITESEFKNAGRSGGDGGGGGGSDSRGSGGRHRGGSSRESCGEVKKRGCARFEIRWVGTFT